MPVFSKSSLGKWLALLSVSALGLPLSHLHAAESAYAKSTIVVYNRNYPNSEQVARHYATARGIPSGNVVELDCPETEEITRNQYVDSIESPLRKLFKDREWWTLDAAGPNQFRVGSSKIHVVALIYGMPLKIQDTGTAPAGLEGQAKMQQSDAASVDSELTLLSTTLNSYHGTVNNPYFLKPEPFAEANQPGMLLVGRLDGPSPDSVIKMISDSVAVERGGLWGRAYIDLAQKTQAGYEMGETWLSNAAAMLEREGFPVITDRFASTFPKGAPLADAALYFGWYDTHANGPFTNPDFHFRPGAVACHIHSFSASTLRTDSQYWVGPLIKRGAAAVLGNVYEPFLSGTTHLDEFCNALLEGYTLAESAYKATQVLSWMTVVVGDPLYRPFEGLQSFEPGSYRRDDETKTYKTLRVALKRWGDSPAQLEAKLRAAGDNHKTGFYLEAMALREQSAGNANQALTLMREASSKYIDPEDKLRVALLMVDIERGRNLTDRALTILRDLKGNPDYSKTFGIDAVTALINQLDPPGPGSN